MYFYVKMFWYVYVVCKSFFDKSCMLLAYVEVLLSQRNSLLW